MVDFVPLGALSGHGAPDPDLGISWYIDSWYFRHVFEKEAEFPELLKKLETSLKTIESLDTCVETVKIWYFRATGNRPRGNQK